MEYQDIKMYRAIPIPKSCKAAENSYVLKRDICNQGLTISTVSLCTQTVQTALTSLAKTKTS